MTNPRKGERKRIEILRAAAGVFRRRGYHGASVDQIASALDMAPGNLYYYFRNKEEILYVCHDYSLGLILKELNDVEQSQLPPDRQIHRLIVAFVHLFIDVLHGTAWTLEVEALSAPRLTKIIAKRDRIDKGFRKILSEGMRSGLFARRDPKLAAFVIFGAINWIPRWYDPAGRATSHEIAQAFADYLVAGLQNANRHEHSRPRVPSRSRRPDYAESTGEAQRVYRPDARRSR
ncbi:MAG TPA: TetR/AcrR family transcriptional regulator [Vicinamibacterales bacterium]|jgi:AcrR family transcriptional regulator